MKAQHGETIIVISQDRELLAWASAKIQEAQKGKIHGTVTIHLEAGTIVRTATNEICKPPGKNREPS